jgi:hypothetical protein
MKNIEELLLKVSEVKTLTESQTNETLKTVLQTEVKSFVKESLDKNDMIEDSDDNMPLDYEEEVVNNEFGDEELSDLLTKLDEEDGDDEMSDDSEETADDTEDKVIDLRGKSKEEIMDFLSSLPDDEVIEFQIEKSEDEDGEEVFDLKSLDDDDELELDIDDQDMDMEDDMNMDDEDMDMDDDMEIEMGDDDDMEDEEEKLDEWIKEALQESKMEARINEYKVIVEQYEQKLNRMQKAYNEKIKVLKEEVSTKVAENLRLKNQKAKYDQALTESKNMLDQLAVHNTNLLHITKLFTEQTVSRDEKVQIAEQFDSVTTINESKILFEALSKTLPKKTISGKNELKDLKDSINESSKKDIIKEEKTFNDPDFDKFNKLVNYKI